MWNTLIVQPISWLLRSLYDLTSSYGLAIILFTVIMKLVFLPFSMKGKKGMMAMQRFSPKLKELEAKYKNDKQKYNEEMSKLYQKEKVNPLSGCIWQLLPFPVLIALFDVVRRPLTNLMNLSADQVNAIVNINEIKTSLTASGIDLSKLATVTMQNQIQIANAVHENFAVIQSSMPDVAKTLMDIDFNFLGMNLSLTPVYSVINVFWFLPILSGIFAWLSMWISQKMNGTGATNDQQNQQMKMFTYISPIMSVWFGFMWPAAMSVYWLINSVLGIAQDYLLTIYYQKVFAAKDAERLKKEEAEKEITAAKKAELSAKRETNLQQSRANASNASKKKYKQLKSQMQPTKPKQADSSGSDGGMDPGAGNDSNGVNKDE